MFLSIGLTIIGLVFISLIAIFYFIKNRQNDLENNIYEALIITTILLLFLELICVFTMSTRYLYPILNEILCRTYILGVIIWIIITIMYLTSFGKKYEKNSDIFKEKIVIIIIVLSTIAFIISCFLGISYESGINKNLYVIGGECVSVLYIVFVILDIYLFYVLIKNKYHVSIFKRLPIIVFLSLFFILTLVQQFTVDFNDLTFLFSFCVISMYFTLENPDIRLVKELEEASIEAEKADKEKTEFLSRMSHEIRTPLNSIMGFSESIINSSNLDLTTLKNDAKNINTGANNLLEIINNILNISRIESGKEVIDEVEYSMKDILYELSSYANAKLEGKDIKFIVDIDNNIPLTLMGDKVKVYSILQGIVNNAIKFTISGKINLVIKSEKNDDFVYLNFEVSDTGMGIKESDIDKIFTKFAKIEHDKNVDNSNSTGLGLAIVKELVTLLNGNISVNSTYGVGTTFNVTIKSKYIGKEIIGEFESKDNNIDINNDYSKYSILIVDDNETTLDITYNLFKTYNFKISTCKKGIDAIEKIKANEIYDMIVIDYTMPEMDGVETLSIIKTLKDNHIPKIKLITSHKNIPEEKEKCLKEGFDEYITKPISSKNLSRIINKYFSSKEGDK